MLVYGGYNEGNHLSAGRNYSFPIQKNLGMPIQAAGAKGIEGKIEIFPEYMEGLKDLEGFPHIFFDIPLSFVSSDLSDSQTLSWTKNLMAYFQPGHRPDRIQ